VIVESQTNWEKGERRSRGSPAGFVSLGGRCQTEAVATGERNSRGGKKGTKIWGWLKIGGGGTKKPG